MFTRSRTKDVFDKLDEQDGAHNHELRGAPTTTTDDKPDAPQDDQAAPQDDQAEPDEPTDKASPQDGGADHSAQPRGSSKQLLRRGVAAAACVAFIVALGSSAYLGWQLKQRDETATASHAALDVARKYAVTLSSIDTKAIDQNFAQVLDGATGEFKDMYSQSAAQLRQLLIDNKAVSTGTVVDAAVKSATKTKVEVLLFVDQSISNSVNPGPRIDRMRIAMTMERVDGRWLASKIDIK